jgi:ATP-binding cassette subfamily E protein 1
LKYFRGSELQNYFTKVLEDNLKALIKPQYVDHIPKAIKGTATVSQMLDSKLEMDNKESICNDLELNHVLDREITHLSGGELQRFAIAMSCIQKADVYVQLYNLYLLYPYLDLFLPDICLTNHQVTLISNNA